MSIEPFFDTNFYLDKDVFICSFISNGKELTELRGLLFIKQMKELMQQIDKKNINKAVFLFDVDKIVLPYNYQAIKSYAQTFIDNKSVIEKSLGFTIIKSKSNVFRIILNLLKQFYTPIKPIYLCDTIENALECVHNEEKRNSLLVLDNKQINNE